MAGEQGHEGEALSESPDHTEAESEPWQSCEPEVSLCCLSLSGQGSSLSLRAPSAPGPRSAAPP